MEARLANAAPREAAPQGGRPAAQAARPRPRPSEPRSPGQQGAGDHGDDPEPAAGPPLSVTPPSLRPAASGWEAPVRAPGVGGQAAASPEHEPGFSSPQREPGGPISSPRQEPGGGRPVTSPQRESPPGGTSGTSPQRESRPPPASVPPPSAPPPSGPPASQPPAARGVRPGAMRPSVFTSGHSAIRDVADDRFGLLAAFVEAVRPRSARLASLIERAALVDAGPSRIAIGFDSRSFEAGLLSDPETHALLASVTEQHLGPSAELELCDIASDATIPTLAKLVTEAGQARRDEVDAELRGHPLVQAALTHLGAELRTVRLPKDVDAAPISLDDARARRLAQRG
ncbi:MAG: hypothetical protein JNK04_05420, partial [Myxococcales bacterium]|nr:hypothetical protein [Myxococcales bacterium]